jgi:hypothetical protein
MLPVGNVAIPTNQTASYIYTSGSTNDLYFTQYLPGTEYTNTTRLRWIESSLATGHQHGGILSTVTGTTTFSLTAGSGLIVEQNASLVEDSYPTVTQVNWPAYVSQSLDFISSSQITYISVNASGTIQQSTTAPTITQYRDRIVLGRILHQTGSVTNGALVAPSVTYGSTNNLLDFTRAFGPLKISGHVLAASGSTLSLTKTAGDSYAEGRNYTTNPESPNIIVSSDDPALTVSKIYRQYLNVSGNVVTDTGVGGAGFTVIDPAQYNTGGALAAVGNSEWTNQRVYWFPKSVNRALFVYYGQEKYPTFSDALEAISVETFTEGSNTAGAAIFIGIITVRGNASTLTATDARITPSGLHRGAGFGGGGGGQASAAGSTGDVQYNDAGVLGAESTFTYNSATDTLSVPNITGSGIASFGTVSGSTVTGSTALFTTITASVVSASSYVGPIPKHSVFAASGITTGSNYEVITINGNKYLQLQKRRTFPIARSIGAADSEYGWIWLNRISISGSSTENTTVVSGANFVHAQSANTTWTAATQTAPVRYKTYTLLAGQNMQVVTKIAATGSLNFDQVQLLVWASGSNTNYVRVGVGYDTGTKIVTQYTSNQNVNTTISASQMLDGVWFAVNITEDNFSSYYNFSTSSTPPASGWLYNTGGPFILATNHGRPLNVGQMIMNGHTNPQTVTGSFSYFDVGITRNELTNFVNPNPYVSWPATQFDTSGTEQLIGEFDLGSSATVNETALRQLLSDLENNQYLENATITWSAVQSSSSGAASGTFYSSNAVVISGSGRYFRLWVKITSNGNQAGSVGPFPIVIPIS